MAAFISSIPFSRSSASFSTSKYSSLRSNLSSTTRLCIRSARPRRSGASMMGPAPLLTPPPATYEAAVSLGTLKASLPAHKVLLLGILAGSYIALGGLLALCVGGATPAVKAANPGLQKLIFGAFGLPLGLTMVCVTGGELFTGNTALVSASFLERRTSLSSLLTNWFWSFVGNFIGGLLVVALACASGTVTGASAAAAAAIATSKVSMPFMTAFAKGIVCNWLVCLAVYMQNGASDFAGKFFAIWLPISAFVAMGFEHSVANMFLVPIGIKCGAKVGMKQFLLGNLLPVTLGNIVAGVFLVAGAYFLAFGRQQ